jgi:hypothetical protein
MLLSLTLLLLALILLSIPWLIWARPTGRELQAGLITIGTTAALLLVTMIVLPPLAHW